MCFTGKTSYCRVCARDVVLTVDGKYTDHIRMLSWSRLPEFISSSEMCPLSGRYPDTKPREFGVIDPKQDRQTDAKQP